MLGDLDLLSAIAPVAVKYVSDSPVRGYLILLPSIPHLTL
jgi:hypothetical protein